MELGQEHPPAWNGGFHGMLGSIPRVWRGAGRDAAGACRAAACQQMAMPSCSTAQQPGGTLGTSGAAGDHLLLPAAAEQSHRERNGLRVLSQALLLHFLPRVVLLQLFMGLGFFCLLSSEHPWCSPQRGL